jgi:hypothetical protein
MLTAIYIFAAIILFALLLFGLWYVARAYRKQRGEQVIICPETHHPAIVEVDATHAALTSLVGHTDMRLQNCSRWPVKKDCGQECLLQVESAPGECLVSSVLAKWYRDKRCVYCGKLFHEINWTDHKPALRNAQREMVEWRDVPIEMVFEVMETHHPVCWNCFVAESFRRDFPEMVVDRPARVGTVAKR